MVELNPIIGPHLRPLWPSLRGLVLQDELTAKAVNLRAILFTWPMENCGKCMGNPRTQWRFHEVSSWENHLWMAHYSYVSWPEGIILPWYLMKSQVPRIEMLQLETQNTFDSRKKQEPCPGKHHEKNPKSSWSAPIPSIPSPTSPKQLDWLRNEWQPCVSHRSWELIVVSQWIGFWEPRKNQGGGWWKIPINQSGDDRRANEGQKS